MVNTATPAFNPLFHCSFRRFCSTPGRLSPGCKRAYPIGQRLPQQGRVHTKVRRYVPQTYMRCRAHDLVEPEANRIPVPPRPPGAPFDGARAWQVLRRLPAYQAAWRSRRNQQQPSLPERAPFPIRLQTVADLAAARFGLLAWLDPLAASGPNSPFWAVVPMLAAAVEAEAVMGDAPAFAVGEAAASAGADGE